MIRLLLLSLCCPGIFGLGTWLCQNSTIGLTRRDPNSCTKFLQCTSLGDLQFQCPMGMVFNEHRNVCDCGFDKICNGRYVQSPCPRMTGPNICEDVTHGALLPHPYACDVFFQCTTVGPLVFKCPAGTVFNPKVNVCDWPHNTSCTSRPAPRKSRQYDQWSWTICNCPPFPGCPCSCAPGCGPMLPLPLEVAITPKPTVTPTPTTTTTSELPRPIIVEVDEDEVEVQNRTSHLSLRMCPSINREDPQQPVHLPHERCQLFYKCFLGQPVAFKCPSGLVWNIGLDRCDYKSDFACQM